MRENARDVVSPGTAHAGTLTNCLIAIGPDVPPLLPGHSLIGHNGATAVNLLSPRNLNGVTILLLILARIGKAEPMI